MNGISSNILGRWQDVHRWRPRSLHLMWPLASPLGILVNRFPVDNSFLNSFYHGHSTSTRKIPQPLSNVRLPLRGAVFALQRPCALSNVARLMSACVMTGGPGGALLDASPAPLVQALLQAQVARTRHRLRKPPALAHLVLQHESKRCQEKTHSLDSTTRKEWKGPSPGP